MTRLSYLRLASLFGLLGSALVISGFFLPSRFVTVVFPPNPAISSADSYWSMLNSTITGGSIALPEHEIGIGSFILAILIPLGISLAGLAGFEKHILFLLSLLFSSLLLSFSIRRGRVTETHTASPGFWLMLSGFLLCIGSSMIRGHRPRWRASSCRRLAWRCAGSAAASHSTGNLTWGRP